MRHTVNTETDAYSAPCGIECERNDCMVRAFAIASTFNYAKVHALFQRHGRKNGCGTPVSMSTHVLGTVLGCTPVTTRQANGAYMTITQFLKAYPKGRYTVHKRGHAFAVVDGVVHDWRPVGSRVRIRRAWRVI